MIIISVCHVTMSFLLGFCYVMHPCLMFVSTSMSMLHRCWGQVYLLRLTNTPVKLFKFLHLNLIKYICCQQSVIPSAMLFSGPCDGSFRE